MEKIKVQLSKIKAVATPAYAHEYDSGMDLTNAGEDKELKPMERALIQTGIKTAIPPGYEIQIRPRSGLALKKGVTVLNTPGTIDSAYRGEIGIIAVNLSNETALIKKGERIAQMVLSKVYSMEIEETEALTETKRGEGGFGSTGE